MPACHRWLRAGFRPGDRVLSVGSIPGGELTLARINTLIRDGQIRVWTLQRGEKVLELSNPREDRRDDRLEEE
jgi:WD40 repeat protein